MLKMGGFFVGREARTLRLLLLTGVSALSFVAAQAQTLPDNTSGTISASQTGPLQEGDADWNISLTSTGIISGGTIGLANAATGGTLTNSGSISGTQDGVFESAGSTGIISNSGSIYGGNDGGVYNAGTISLLTNAADGTISGAEDGGVFNNSGTIGDLDNSGTISGGPFGVINFNASTI